MSVAQFFESNGVPYRTSEKWYKVAGDEESWQQIAVRAFEGCEQVMSYVCNQFLEFYILYLEGDDSCAEH